MSATRLFAGIDGGGSKTEIVVVDEQGVEQARRRTTTCNQSIIGREAALATLREGLATAMGIAATPGSLEHAWFGLAGFDRGEDHTLMAPALASLAQSITLTNDAELVLAALPGASGVALIAGTGSIAVGRNTAGHGVRAGGWGHVFGDEGSGYELGRRALQAAAMMDDGRGPATTLLPRLLAHWGLTSAPQLITRVYGDAASKSEIAALADLVVAATEEGDTVASALLDGAAADLAVTALAVAECLGFDGGLPLALAGGLLTNVTSLREATVSHIAERWSLATVAVVTDPALAGARAAIHLGATSDAR